MTMTSQLQKVLDFHQIDSCCYVHLSVNTRTGHIELYKFQNVKIEHDLFLKLYYVHNVQFPSQDIITFPSNFS